MKKELYFIKLIFIFFSIFTLSSCTSVPSDISIMGNFNNHIYDYNAIVRLSREEPSDKKIAFDYVTYDAPISNQPTPTPEENIRFKKYRAMMRNIGIVNYIGIGKDRVYFGIYDSGFGGDGLSKGLLWSVEAPRKILKSLDILPKKRGSGISAWRKIADNWYIEYDG